MGRLPTRLRFGAVCQIARARLRELCREPVALFWVFGFPQVVLLTLGFTFTDRPPEALHIDVVIQSSSSADRDQLLRTLAAEPRLVVHAVEQPNGKRLARVESSLVLVAKSSVGDERPNSYELIFDPDRPDSRQARAITEAAILRGQPLAPEITVRTLSGPRSRYVDFLVPSLLAVGVMGGSLVAVGYTVVEMRMRRLLRVFLSTPLQRHELFLGLMLGRLAFLIPEAAFVLIVGRVLFDVRTAGNLVVVIVVLLAGASAFMSIGLLIGARGRTLEAASGWVSVLMLLQWIFCGVFFSRSVFPERWQALLRWIPLSALVDALRAVMQDGQGLGRVAFEMSVLIVWTVFPFALAWRRFRVD